MIGLCAAYMDLIPDDRGGYTTSVQIVCPSVGGRLVTAVTMHGVNYTSPVPVTIYALFGAMTKDDEAATVVISGESDAEYAARTASVHCLRRKLGADGKPLRMGDRAAIELVPASERFILSVSNLPRAFTDSTVAFRLRSSYSLVAGQLVMDEAKARAAFRRAAVLEAKRLDSFAARDEELAFDPQELQKVRQYRAQIAAAKGKMVADAASMTLQQLIDYGDPWPPRV